MTELFNIKSFRDRRRELRQKSTSQEKILWERLRNNELGYKFRRQYSVGGYILDFCCANKKLGIEIDGPVHQQSKEYDKLRDTLTTDLGYTILRFSNSEVESDIEAVIHKISSTLDTIKGRPSSLGKRGVR